MDLLKIIQVSRPIGWLISAILYLVGIKLSGSEFGIVQIIQMLLLTLPYCFFLFGINDIYDFESDKNNPRKGNFLQGARIQKQDMLFIKKMSLVFGSGLIFVSLFAGFWNFICTVLLLLASYFYSAPPVRFKELPIIDTLSNSAIIYLVLMLGFTQNALPWELIHKVYVVLLLVSGFNAYHTIVDFESDRKTSHRTFAVIFGKRATAGFCFLCAFVAMMIGDFESIEFNLIMFAAPVITLATIFVPKAAKILMYVGGFSCIFLAAEWLARTTLF
jgi:4-hydroxybenzoate polyprenyltransferase